MQLISQRIFTTELKRLRQLALTATYSFRETRRTLIDQVRTPDFDRESQIILNDDTGESLETFQVLHRLKSQAPRYLLELLFTRSISSLEVFLIDSIREIGKVAPEKFKSDEQISFSREQISSFLSIDELQDSLIDKDCRQLSSGGFQEITKFYKNKLKIDYRSLGPGILKLEEYHDRRHLLVHKLGQVDDAYKHKYNSIVKKLSVDTEYLTQVIDNLLLFSEQLNSKVSTELFGVSVVVKPETNRHLYVIEIKNLDVLPECLKPGYLIKTGENPVILSSILLKSSIQKRRMVLVVEGDGEIMELLSDAICQAHQSGKLQVKFANPKKLHNLFIPNKYRSNGY